MKIRELDENGKLKSKAVELKELEKLNKDKKTK